MGHRTRVTAAAVTVFGLMVAGCGGSDDLADRLADPDAPISADELDELVERMAEEAAEAEEAERDAAGAGGDDTPAEPEPEPEPELPAVDPADFPPIAERSIDAVVVHGSLEWEVQEMIVVDLDADIQPGDRPQGVELTFPARVFNAGSSTAAITGQLVELQWEEPATGDAFAARGQIEFREIPARSFSSGEIIVQLSPEDRQIFVADTAALVFGRAGITQSVVPVGDAAELVARFPVPQDTTGWELNIEGPMDARRNVDDVITVTDAIVRWSDPELRPLEDGNVLLELTYTIENRSEGQTCSQRGEGAWRLTLPNGDSINDMRVSERCAAQDDTVTGVLTGFTIPTEDFPGEYRLSHQRGSGGSDDPSDEITITLTADGGLRWSELVD